MSTRPALLFIESEAGRRLELGRDLAEAGYEVVPAVDADEGLRFARGLGPAVIVASAELAQADDGSLLAALAASGDAGGETAARTLVLLGRGEPPAALPEEAIFLRTEGLDHQVLFHKLRLALIGREVGIETDTRLEALVGDLALLPLLEVLRSLGEVLITGTIELQRGTIHLRRGEVVAAQAGPVSGRKAFCRLVRISEGPFRVRLAQPPVEDTLDEDLDSLIVAAIEDSLGDFPDLRSRVRVEMKPEFFRHTYSAAQQEILVAAQKGATLGELLDACAAADGAVVQGVLRLAELGVAVIEAPAATVQVVTDSTSDLPARLAKAHGTEIVPLTVQLGERMYRDGVDLEPREFYRLLETKRHHPSTSPPFPDEIGAFYRRHAGERPVVSVHISSRLSQTCDNAREAAEVELAAQAAGGARIEIVDTRSVSFGLGLMALFAARMAAREVEIDDIVARLRKWSAQLHIFFVVDTLDFLARGGRIGRAQGWIGNLLGIKPILTLVDGEVVPLDKVRGGRATHPRLIELTAGRVDPGRPIFAAVSHAKAPMWADRLGRLVKERFQVAELFVGEIGPVVGTHVGPGAVGLMVIQPDADELPLVEPLEA